MTERCLSLLLLLAICIASPVQGADNLIRYPRAPAGDDFRPLYPAALLRLALSEAGSTLRVVPSQEHMEQSRALLSLEQEDAVDVVWTMTSQERERRFLPVRIPLDKGLYGWRIALLRKDNAGLLDDVHNLADLQQWRAGQGHDWPDTKILRSNGLPVSTSSSYDSLFFMLRSGRFHYFPRAVLEVQDELRRRNANDLVLDQQIVLHYPTALYFFFSRQRPELAETVRIGLEQALANGGFERLFQQYHGQDLTLAHLAERRVIELHNPLLPAATPLQRQELWFQP